MMKRQHKSQIQIKEFLAQSRGSRQLDRMKNFRIESRTAISLERYQFLFI